MGPTIPTGDAGPTGDFATDLQGQRGPHLTPEEAARVMLTVETMRTAYVEKQRRLKLVLIALLVTALVLLVVLAELKG